MYNSSFDNDCRVRAKGKRRPQFDRQKMTLTLGTLILPAKFKVCSLCEGKGTHTNPSIDSHGLSSDDFAEDPDFAESYFSGQYDVQCYRCNGERIIPVVDMQKLTNEQKTKLKAKRNKAAKRRRADAEYNAMVQAERRMGC
jgi:hypothetical protein